jgi:hypothetical protein
VVAVQKKGAAAMAALNSPIIADMPASSQAETG